MKSEDERVKTLLKKKGLLENYQKRELNESKSKLNYYIKQIFAFLLGIAGLSGIFYIWNGLDTRLGPAIDAGNVGVILGFAIISIITICCLAGAWRLENSTYVAGRDSEIPKTGVKNGVALMKAGKFPEAICVFDEAIAVNPNDQDAKYFRAVAQQKIEESNILNSQSNEKQTN